MSAYLNALHESQARKQDIAQLQGTSNSTTHPNINAFDQTKDDVECWLNRFRLFMETQTIQFKYKVLLSYLDSTTSKAISNNVEEEDDELAFQEAMLLLKEMFKKPRIAGTDAYKTFHERRQKADENVTMYGTHLISLAKDASLDTYSSFISDHFITGLRDDYIKRSLTLKRNKHVRELIKEAARMEDSL